MQDMKRRLKSGKTKEQHVKMNEDAFNYRYTMPKMTTLREIRDYKIEEFGYKDNTHASFEDMHSTNELYYYSALFFENLLENIEEPSLPHGMINLYMKEMEKQYYMMINDTCDANKLAFNIIGYTSRKDFISKMENLGLRERYRKVNKSDIPYKL